MSKNKDGTGKTVGIKEYMEKIKAVKKEEVIDIANNINIDTIYFLKN